jgi:hypothetical protein
VRLPRTNEYGLLPLGDVWVHVDALRVLPTAVLAALSGATGEEVEEARGVRDRTTS